MTHRTNLYMIDISPFSALRHAYFKSAREQPWKREVRLLTCYLPHQMGVAQPFPAS